MRTTYITATIIAVACIAWLLSGQLGQTDNVEHTTLAEQNQLDQARRQDELPTRVRARIINASPQLQHVVLRGKTSNNASRIICCP